MNVDTVTPNTPPERLPAVLTAEQLAAWLQLPTPAAARELLRQGRVRGAVRVGHRWRIPRAAVLGLFDNPAENEVTP